MSSKRVEMWGEGLEAKGDARSWERWARGEGRGCVLGVCPHLPHHPGEGVHARAGGKNHGGQPRGIPGDCHGGY